MMSMMPSALPPCDSNVDTILTLPEQTGSLAIADACRSSALAFLNESDRWGKAELAMWLMGPYAQLTQYVAPIAQRKSGEYVARPVPLLREIDVRMVERVIRSAHDEVTATLRRVNDVEASASFAFSMISSGFVACSRSSPSTTSRAPPTTRPSSRSAPSAAPCSSTRSPACAASARGTATACSFPAAVVTRCPTPRSAHERRPPPRL